LCFNYCFDIEAELTDLGLILKQVVATHISENSIPCGIRSISFDHYRLLVIHHVHQSIDAWMESELGDATGEIFMVYC
jgi:hypothetical protein